MTKFQEKVYQTLRKVPRGKVTTYQDLAHAINTRAYRAVGTAMAKNPDIPKTPCHRVIKADGSVGNYLHGTARKTALLKAEGIKVINDKIDLKKYGWEF
jgi:methylated-DNA-[protein]-cysteine S-methyltransferase